MQGDLKAVSIKEKQISPHCPTLQTQIFSEQEANSSASVFLMPGWGGGVVRTKNDRSITNSKENFENIDTKKAQMAYKLIRITENGGCVELQILFQKC